MKEDWSGDREQASRCLFRTILLWGVYLSEVTDPCENMIIDILFLNITHVYIKKKEHFEDNFWLVQMRLRDSPSLLICYFLDLSLSIAWTGASWVRRLWPTLCCIGTSTSSQGGPQCRADPSGFWCARRRASLTVPRGQITPDPRLSRLGEEGHGQISTQLLRKCWQDTGQKQSRLHLRHFAEERTGGRLWAGPDVDFSGRRSQRMSLRTIV